MKNNPKLLAYSLDNKAAAKEFEADLSKAGITFRHFIGEHSNSSIAKELLKADGEVFMLISDNFLKSSHCMVDALELLAKGIQGNRIQAIIVGSNPENGTEAQPTQFSRISDLINYMNFWQERYLKLRKTKDTIPKGKMDEFEKELKCVRLISAEIGEFLRMLRDTDYWTLEQLQSDHYSLFFNKIGKQDLINTFQKESQPPTPPEQELEAIKKELNISNTPVTDPEINDPEIQESAIQMKKEQEETQQIFSSIFEREEGESEAETTNEDIDSDSFQNWNEIQNEEDSESELTNKMKLRFFERVDQLIENGDEITAARELNQYLNANRKSAEAHYYLALIESSNEAFDLAKQHAEQAVEFRPDNSNYHLTLGRILFHHFSDNPKSAEHSFKNAIQMNPANIAAHYEYAMLLHEVLEKPKKAINQLEFTLAIQPEHPFANYDLALIYYGMEKREKAAMYYEKAFSINSELRTPDNDIAFWYESYLQAELEETNQAVEQLEEVEEVEQLEELEEVTPEVVTPEEIEDYLDPEEALMNEMKDQNELDLEIAELLLEKDEVEDSLSDREVIIVSPEPKAEEEIEIDSTPLTPPNRQSNNTVKTIMITGATSGIGKATAILFAKAGHRLILTGRREGRLNEFKKELQSKYNNDITVLDFDVRYLSAAKRCYNSMGPEWENIDLLINNAGLAKGFDPIHEGDVKHWEVMLDTNVKGLLYTTRIVSPGMVARGHGQIINICSSAGHEVYPNGAVYCASKHAVDALTKGMRLDLFKHGIRVGQVSPGHVEETEFAVVRFDGDKERAKIYNDFNPLTSSDVADAIFYMANAPAHVTIQDIVIMGTQQASNIFIHRSGRNNS